MEIWGITGLAGTGKSSATKYLAEQGYPTVDADQLTKLAVDRNTEVGREGFSAIYKLFGDSILDRTKNLDRSLLRKRLMENPSDQARLQNAIDPIVLAHIEKLAKDWAKTSPKYAFVEGARLVEAGLHNVLKGIIQVTAPIDKRITRVAKRDSMGKDEVDMMFKLQDREELMRRIAKVQWKNDGTPKALTTEIDKFLNRPS